jgi:hypothetical protein
MWNRTTVVGLPLQIESNRFLSTVITQPVFVGKSFIVVVTDKKHFRQVTGLRIGDTHLFDYSTLTPEILKGLAISPQPRYLFSDNLNSLIKTSWLNKIDKGTFLITLAPWPSSDTMIDAVRKRWPDMVLVQPSFATLRPQVTQTPEVVRMSPIMTQRYEERVQNELEQITSSNKSESHAAQKRLRSLREATYEYPDAQWEVVRLPGSKTGVVDVDVSLGGWMTREVFTTISIRGPKLARLLSIFAILPGARHVIYTRFKEHYGAALISSLLRYAGYEHVVLTGDLKVADKHAVLEKFNSKSVPILITTVVPQVELQEVDRVHWIEPPEIAKVVEMLTITAKYPLVLGNQTHHYYLALRADSDASTVDADFYQQLTTSFRLIDDLHNQMMFSAIKFTQMDGVYIM